MNVTVEIRSIPTIVGHISPKTVIYLVQFLFVSGGKCPTLELASRTSGARIFKFEIFFRVFHYSGFYFLGFRPGTVYLLFFSQIISSSL